MPANTQKNVFFGLQALLPAWVKGLPKGRIVPANSRHMLLAFLGKVSEELFASLAIKLEDTQQIAATGIASRVIFTPDTVALDIELITGAKMVYTLADKLKTGEPFYPHVTLARTPVAIHAWKQWFFPLPLIFPKLCLYSSEGELAHRSLAEKPFWLPFEQKEHTADLAVLVRGRNFSELAFHALLSLAFQAPEMLEGAFIPQVDSLVDVIAFLNQRIFSLDRKFGLPFKAVTHSGHAEELNGYLTWEMIVDV